MLDVRPLASLYSLWFLFNHSEQKMYFTSGQGRKLYVITKILANWINRSVMNFSASYFTEFAGISNYLNKHLSVSVSGGDGWWSYLVVLPLCIINIVPWHSNLIMRHYFKFISCLRIFFSSNIWIFYFKASRRHMLYNQVGWSQVK